MKAGYGQVNGGTHQLLTSVCWGCVWAAHAYMSSTMKFLIMNGAGNRFGVFDARNTPGFSLSDAQTIEIAKPGGKIMGEKGADQIVILRAPTSSDADIFMEIRNQQGFEVNACGNATRTTAWLHMRDAQTDKCVVETNDGLLPARLAWVIPIASFSSKNLKP